MTPVGGGVAGPPAMPINGLSLGTDDAPSLSLDLRSPCPQLTPIMSHNGFSISPKPAPPPSFCLSVVSLSLNRLCLPHPPAPAGSFSPSAGPLSFLTVPLLSPSPYPRAPPAPACPLPQGSCPDLLLPHPASC
jgi:hypothetical protein